VTDLVDAVLASCDRWGPASGLSSAPRSGPRIETAPRGLSSAPRSGPRIETAPSGLSSAPRSGPRIETLTYAELGSAIRSTAAGLRAAGMRRGDRVLFSVRPGPDAVILALGVVHAGGTVVFADPGAGETLFRARTALAAPTWVAAESLLYLASTRPLRRFARSRGLDLAPYAQVVPDARHLYAGRWLPGVPRGALSVSGLRSAPRAGGVARPAGDDEALIVFTSGTTEAPRAVVHTRASLGAGLGDIAGAAMRPGQRVVTDQLMVGIPALIAGAHWIMPTPGLDPGAAPRRYLELLPDADALFVSPAALDAILRLLESSPHLAPRRLETLLLGGAPVLRPLLRRAVERFPGVTIRAVYGMTEILPVAIADGAEKLARADAAGDYAGRLVPSVRARLDDGELVLAGPGLASRYLGEQPLTEVRTGDLARLDGDEVTLLGRRKDMFIRGTQNVYPALYEPVIAGLPGVREAVLSGVPDAIGDDRIVVVVVPSTDPPRELTTRHPLAAAVRAALPGLLDAGVLPDVVCVSPELPRSGRSRKLDRRAIAQQVQELLPAPDADAAGSSGEAQGNSGETHGGRS